MLGRTGIAETFLRAGVSGLLGTYWPVGDRSAQLFAQTFYSRLAQGQVIGLALHDARSALWRQTWATGRITCITAPSTP